MVEAAAYISAQAHAVSVGRAVVGDDHSRRRRPSSINCLRIFVIRINDLTYPPRISVSYPGNAGP